MVTPKFVYSLYETRLQNNLKNETLPKHIGIIHDGHRRYARRENLLSYEVSYRIGMVRFKECLAWCDELGIDNITSWLLSKENLSRPEDELNSYYLVLNELFEELLIDDLVDNFKINFVGSIDLLPDYLQNSIKKLKEVRGGGEKLLTIALGYGGRQEIVDAMKSLLQENQELEIQDLIKSINDEQIRDHLYSPNSPDIDLIIRTSGESRLSGFLLWQSAYSEVVLVNEFDPLIKVGLFFL
jgi:short-chain Z-isoprenyl diphosphate synthase